MNWDAIGAIGQLVGSIAVFVTLVYLSIQVRHAREQAMRSAERARCDAAREYWLALATQPELSGAWETYSSATGTVATSFVAHAVTMGLTATSARQLEAFVWAGWQNFEASIEAHRDLSAGVRIGLENRIIYNYRSSGPFSKWYETTKEELNPDAVRYVDNLLSRSG